MISKPLQPFTEIPAGAFGAWLAAMRASLQGRGGSDVPCGDCVGCCVSSYFIPIRPEDTAALDAIPAKFLGSSRPRGHWVMGYREDGTCPMLQSRKCTIYAHRPQTCRDYDCRVFAAAGMVAGGPDKAVINERVRAWRFTYPAETDHAAHRAVQAAATFIRERREDFPQGRAPTAPTGIAVLAVKVYELFLDETIHQRPASEIAAAIVAAARAFDAAGSAT